MRIPDMRQAKFQTPMQGFVICHTIDRLKLQKWKIRIFFAHSFCVQGLSEEFPCRQSLFVPLTIFVCHFDFLEIRDQERKIRKSNLGNDLGLEEASKIVLPRLCPAYDDIIDCRILDQHPKASCHQFDVFVLGEA